MLKLHKQHNDNNTSFSLKDGDITYATTRFTNKELPVFELYEEDRFLSLLELDLLEMDHYFIDTDIQYFTQEIFELKEIEVRRDEVVFTLAIDGNGILGFTEFHPKEFISLLTKFIADSKFNIIGETQDQHLEDRMVEFSIQAKLPNNLSQLLEYIQIELNDIWSKILINKLSWKDQYEKDEEAFSKEFLEPLFRRIGFDSVRYNHGSHEYGKDFILSNIDLLGKRKFYGVQVKRGDLSGKATAQVNEIFEQIRDAFSEEFFAFESNKNEYISEMLVIISAKYTHQAKKKIVDRLKLSDPGLLGNISFLDKESCLNILNKYVN